MLNDGRVERSESSKLIAKNGEERGPKITASARCSLELLLSCSTHRLLPVDSSSIRSLLLLVCPSIRIILPVCSQRRSLEAAGQRTKRRLAAGPSRARTMPADFVSIRQIDAARPSRPSTCRSVRRSRRSSACCSRISPLHQTSSAVRPTSRRVDGRLGGRIFAVAFCFVHHRPLLAVEFRGRLLDGITPTRIKKNVRIAKSTDITRPITRFAHRTQVQGEEQNARYNNQKFE